MENRGPIAAALETGVYFDFWPGLQLRQREFHRTVHHAGDAQPVVLLADLRLVVMLNNVEIVHRRIERVDVARIEEVDPARHHGRRRKRLGHVGEWNDFLPLGQGEP